LLSFGAESFVLQFAVQKFKIYGTIILPHVLYGYETWLLTLRKTRRLKVSENWVLRKIFGPMREEVTGMWTKLHNEELNDLYSSCTCLGDKIEENGIGWACSMYGEGRGIYRVLVGKPEGKRHLGRPGHRWSIILRRIFWKWDLEVWTGLVWLRIGTGGGQL
jgi:hypothetical protein